jgi:hypothetical protein
MSQCKKEPVPYEYIEGFKYEDFAKLNISEADTSDTGSNIDENDYLSDEEIANKYTFLQKPKRKFKQNNQYKEQFKIEPKTKQLEEEEYVSD